MDVRLAGSGGGQTLGGTAPSAEADLERFVARALHWGATWAEIAAAVPTTRQSAHQRYRRLRYDPSTGTTWHKPPLPI